jgi:hypothetical protein
MAPRRSRKPAMSDPQQTFNTGRRAASWPPPPPNDPWESPAADHFTRPPTMSETQPEDRSPEPLADLMAQAAEILGVSTGKDRGNAVTPAMVMVNLAGPQHHKIMRIRSDVPVGRLAADIGQAVGVTVVARLSVRNGETISPAETLADAGVRAGSMLLVDSPDASGIAPGTPIPLGDSRSYWEGQPAQHHTPNRDRPPTRRPRPAMFGVIGAGIAAVSMLIGATVFGGGNSARAATSRSTLAVGYQAANAWVNGTSFNARRLGDVPANLGRSGPAPKGTVEAVSASTSNDITNQLFIVTPATGSAFGLSVVIFKDQLAYPPTVTPLPFAATIPAGQTPSVPQTGKIVANTAAQPANAWAAATFSPSSPTGQSLGFVVDGKAEVVAQWDPARGAAFVARVEVPMSGVLPGSADAGAIKQAGAAVTSAASDVTADQRTLTKDRAAVSSDIQAVSRANKAVLSDDAAAQQAASASATANPALAAAAITAQQTAVTAQRTATAARNMLSADQHTVAKDSTQLSAAKKAGSAAIAALITAKKVGLTKVIGVYDVAFNRANQPTAWAPADYLIGAS